VRRRSNTDTFAMVDGLLGQTEVALRPPANLDHDEGGWRTRVDRDEVDLIPADVDVPAQDRPARTLEAFGDERLRGIARPLGLGPGPSVGAIRHGSILTSRPYVARTGCRLAAVRNLQAGAVISTASSASRSSASSIASSTMTGVSSRARSSWVDPDAA